MKLLSDCLSDLAIGELSNTALVTNGGIKEDKLDLVLRLLNDGLASLYLNLNLGAANLILEPVEGKRTYEISSEHLMDKTLEVTYDKYLFAPKDQPFTNNLIKILEVTSNTGKVWPLNCDWRADSMFTPTYNVLVIPELDKRVELNILYQCSHPKLSKDNLEAKVKLPIHLFPALYALIAFNVHSNINTAEAVQNAQKYQALYTSILNNSIERNSDEAYTTREIYKFNSRGWV